MQEDDYNKALEKWFQNWDDAAEETDKENSGSISRAFEFQTRLEQAPNPNSRISLDTEKNALGVPKSILHWELTELD